MRKALTITTAGVLGTLLPIVSVLAAPAVYNGWVQSNDTWYYYNAGTKILNSWAMDSTRWSFLNSIDGSRIQEGWAKDSHGWCYIKNGYWVNHAAWAKDSAGWQYIGADGYWDSTVAVQATNPVDAATAAVAKAEATKLASDLQSASSKVDTLNAALPEKSLLSARLTAIKAVDDLYYNTFDYNSISALISSCNSMVQSNNYTISKLNQTYNSIDTSISQLKAYAASIKDDPAKTAQYNDTLEQIKELEYQKSDTEVLTGQVAVQASMSNDQIVAGAETLILSYKTLNLESDKLNENILSLQRNIDMMNIYKNQGMATDLDISKLQLNLASLNYTKNNLASQMDNIKMQLNLLIAKPYDNSARIVFDSSLLDNVDLTVLNKQVDLDKAVANSYNIRLEYYAIKKCNNALARASDDYGTNSSQYSVAMLDYNSAVLKQDETIRSERLKFNQIYDAVIDKQNALSLEKSKLAQERTNLDTANIKFNLGMISKKALEDAVTAYNLQLMAMETAKINLFTNYRHYQWMLKGLAI